MDYAIGLAVTAFLALIAILITMAVRDDGPWDNPSNFA